MTTPVILYEPSISYTIYGEPLVSSGVVWSGAAYIGKLSAFDRDLILKSDFYIRRFDGEELKYFATLLTPFYVDLKDTYTVKTADETWEIQWTNESTSDAVQAYSKAIMKKTTVLE
jgi:hypothetical protein